MMKIGIPKEIKDHEYRVALTSLGVREIVQQRGGEHRVLVEKDAGVHVGVSNDDYTAAGAEIISGKEALYGESDLIVKVKEPQMSETALMHDGQIIFSYLHLAVEGEMTRALCTKGVTGIAFETITGDGHPLPLLFPMSEVAGKLSVQAGAKYLEKANGGRGILLGGAVGTPPARVVILGGGTAGAAAAQIALGMGAEVTILERNLDRMRALCETLSGRFRVLYSSQEMLEREVPEADLLIGTILIPGAAAAKIVSRELVKKMRPGAVIVDIAIDQGGCIETSRPTTHSDPVYVDEGVIHYCVTNMPAAVPRTSTHALENAILNHLLAITGKGITAALNADPHLANGVNVHRNAITNEPVASSLGESFTPLSKLL